VDSGPIPITHAVHNLSGTYSYSWTVKDGYGSTIGAYCAPNVGGPCLTSGCTYTSSSCVLQLPHGYLAGRTYIATGTLIQSGLSRTISATADLAPAFGGSCCQEVPLGVSDVLAKTPDSPCRAVTPGRTLTAVTPRYSAIRRSSGARHRQPAEDRAHHGLLLKARLQRPRLNGRAASARDRPP
jgi:hypothetical protein